MKKQTKKITMKEEQAILDRVSKYIVKNLNPLCPHVIYGFLENLKIRLITDLAHEELLEVTKVIDRNVDQSNISLLKLDENFEIIGKKFDELVTRLDKLEKKKEVKTNGKK